MRHALPAIEYLFNHLSEGMDLDSIDGRARLASAVSPYVDKVPDGILKQLMRDRLKQATGFAARPPAGASEAEPARPEPPARPLNNDPLHQRLLTLLLKQPMLLAEVSAERRQAVLDRAQGTLLAEIVSYIDKTIEAGALTALESSAILGRWAGSAVYGELLALFERPILLNPDAMRGEFTDSVAALLAAGQRADNRALLNDMQQDPSIEKLRELVARKRQHAARSGSDEG